MGLKSDDAHTTQLQAILHAAHALKEVAAASLPPSRTLSIASSPPRAIVDPIRLPSPCPLYPSLLEAGAGHEIASAASRIYLQRAEELRHTIEQSVIATSHRIAELPIVAPALSPDLLMEKVVSTSTGVYLRRLAQWKEEITQRVARVQNIPPKATPKNAFNYEYVPLLEQFFEENPFPTHADKKFLAKKSNMEYRQIHVWFQNRRNRSKNILGKKPAYRHAARPLDKFYKHMDGPLINFDSRASKPSGVCSLKEVVNDNNRSKDTFTSASPLHAFPSSYPPVCSYDPFPCKSGPVYFGKSEWRRTASGKQSPPVSSSIDDLVERFSRLNVRDGTCFKESPDSRSHAATLAITIVPSRAPHPSLITSKHSHATNIVTLYPLVRTPVCSRAFQSPSPTSKPVTLVPPSVPIDKRALHKRKIAPLPQCFPSRIQNTHRDTPSSEGSSTPSPRSFSTDFESGDFSVSSTSSRSTPSDPGNIEELPYLSGGSCRSPLDSTIRFCDLEDMVVVSPSFVS